MEPLIGQLFELILMFCVIYALIAVAYILAAAVSKWFKEVL